MFLRLHPGRCGLHCGAWTHSPACWTGPGPRAQGAFLLRSVLDPARSVRIQDRAPLSLIALLRGQAWLVPDTGDRVALHPGDVAIIRGPDPYTVADDPATPVGCRNSFMQLVGGTRGADRRADPAGAHGADPR